MTNFFKKAMNGEDHPRPKPKTVYIIGAGFSKEFGYPLTQDLLHLLPNGINDELEQIIRFHYPSWDGKTETIPDIEKLLTALDANEELLPDLIAGGRFNARSVRLARVRLLQKIAEWFHGIHKRRSIGQKRLLQNFREQHACHAASIISFNWDYELDKHLLDGQPSRQQYGIDVRNGVTPVLLKPHGSLNWYVDESVEHVKGKHLELLYEGSGKEGHESIYRFLPWRAPQTKRREYVPWIVPPTHYKRFGHPMLRRLWNRSVTVLSTATRVYFLGYSQPETDWHSRYILRCGFYNQEHGVPHNGKRSSPTGKATVTVVNPDEGAFRRIESTVGWPCEWLSSTVKHWLNKPPRVL